MKIKSKELEAAPRPKKLKLKNKVAKKLTNGNGFKEKNTVLKTKQQISPNKESKKKNKKGKVKKSSKPQPKIDEDDSELDANDNENVESDIESETNEKVPIRKPMKNEKQSKSQKKGKSELKLHKKDLESLKDIDPEFYTFLQQNDKKLLEFGLGDSDDGEDTADSDEEKNENNAESAEEDEEEIVHKPSENLEVASDESDFHDSDEDDEEDSSASKVVTLKLLRQWQAELQGSKVKISTIRNVVQAFSSALASVSEGKTGTAIYKVEGSAAFNGVIQLCVLYLQPGIYRFLGQHEKSELPLHKCKKWKNLRAPLKNYLVDLSRLVEHVSSSNILRVVLKHLHQVAAMVGSYAQITKPILKRLIVLWSASEEESVRVLAFLCILKITRNQQTSVLNHVLKAMYLAYVRNSKFVSPNTLANINFMRRSLVEMFALDLNTTYQHAFLYIRQLAIHLRNAVILKKKDSFKAVYNWQYINSLRLWTDLLGATAHRPQLQPLVYPLVTITTGVIKLIPTAQYFPLRFHCIKALINLQKQSNMFIPVLPFILEVLNSNSFNKKHTIASMKPMSFACILRLNKSQMAENGFRDEVVENVCGLTLEILAHESSSLAYPDLIVPCVLALKQYLKVCKVANYARKLKQLLDKIVENSKFVEAARNKIKFGLHERNLIQSWETNLRNKGTPLNVYYTSWVKTHEIKRKRQAANTDDINDYNMPMIKRRKADEMEKQKKTGDGPTELFPSDSENEDQINDDAKIESTKDSMKEKKMKKKKMKEKKDKQVAESVVDKNDDEEDDADDGVDIVKDLDLDDW